MTRTLTLIRGLPGSGKSTLAKQLKGIHLEADMYFYDDDGEYNFDASRLHEVHTKCRYDTEEYLRDEYNVTVSNTFTTLKEMMPYYDMAQRRGVILNIITCHGNFGNVHDVPEETLAKMKARFFHGDVLSALKERFEG